MEKNILTWLREVEHPAKGDKNIVELGMVEKVEVAEGSVTVTLAFSKHRDPLAEYLIGSAKAALIRNTPAGTKVEVKTIIKNEAPKKKPGLDLGFEEVANVKHIVGIASGKGGVGKSTVSVNLAVALARLGYKVGLADADVYGPSVPKMTATEGLMPDAIQEGEKEVILPMEKYGVKWMSIGYFARPEQALIWRGPMACNALKQMILQVRWGELDFLLIDMPPGTGDIHISLVHDIPLEGAVIVSTPQDVALADVEKGVNMFRNKDVNKPIFGLVENGLLQQNILTKNTTFSDATAVCAWQRNIRFLFLVRYRLSRASVKVATPANLLPSRPARTVWPLWHWPKNLQNH